MKGVRRVVICGAGIGIGGEVSAFFLSQDYSLNDVSGMEMLKQTPQDKEREALWRAASMEVIQPPREEHWDQVHWRAWSKMMSPRKQQATESLEREDVEEEKEESEVSDESSVSSDGGLPLAVRHAMKSKGKSRMRLADLEAEEVNDDVDGDDEEMDQEDYGLDRMEPGPSDTGDEIMTVADPEPPAPVPVPGGPVESRLVPVEWDGLLSWAEWREYRELKKYRQDIEYGRGVSVGSVFNADYGAIVWPKGCQDGVALQKRGPGDWVVSTILHGKRESENANGNNSSSRTILGVSPRSGSWRWRDWRWWSGPG